MDVPQLIEIVSRKLQFLTRSKDDAFQRGDVDQVLEHEKAIEITQKTINLLKSLT
jgi:hypothetical protein